VRWIPGKYTPVTEPMVEAYKKKTGFSPSTFAVQAHDAALVTLQAIATAGSTDPAKIAAALEAGKFTAAWGERKFTPLAEGHRMPVNTIVAQIQDGKKAVVYPEDIASAQGSKYKAVPPWGWEKK
jgi:ABC-type branched-subunit amino acid transport system substrate-binding protein